MFNEITIFEQSNDHSHFRFIILTFTISKHFASFYFFNFNTLESN